MFPVCDLVGRFLCSPALSLFRADCLLGSENAGPPSPGGGGQLPSLSSRQPLSVGATCVSSLVAAWPLVLTPLLCLEVPVPCAVLLLRCRSWIFRVGAGWRLALRWPCRERSPSSHSRSLELLLRHVQSSPLCLQRSACPHLHPGYLLSQIFQFLCLQVQLGSSKPMVLNVLVRCPLFLLSLEQVGQS